MRGTRCDSAGSQITCKGEEEEEESLASHSQFMSRVTVADMGDESLELVARHSKTACRCRRPSSVTLSVTLVTPSGSCVSSEGHTSSFTRHCTVGVGRPAGGSDFMLCSCCNSKLRAVMVQRCILLVAFSDLPLVRIF